jgi:hypothetical protein
MTMAICGERPPKRVIQMSVDADGLAIGKAMLQ